MPLIGQVKFFFSIRLKTTISLLPLSKGEYGYFLGKTHFDITCDVQWSMNIFVK